jgi:hypothetical protein
MQMYKCVDTVSVNELFASREHMRIGTFVIF